MLTAVYCCVTFVCLISREYAFDVPKPGAVEAQDMIELGKFVRDIFKLNEDSKNFRIFWP